MNNLDTYIKDNAKAFDVEPSKGHFERFEQKLQTQNSHRRRNFVHKTMRVAAVGLLLIMSGLYITDRFIIQEDNTMTANHEFREAQVYYQTRINNGLNTIKSIDGGMTEEQREMLLDEMSNADDLFKELQKDYEANPDDPRVIEAMLNHYRMKAKVINSIISDLEKANAKEEESIKHSITL